VPQVKVGRNEPCPCGSGKKYKRCCLKEREKARLTGAAWQPDPAGRPDVFLGEIDFTSNHVIGLIEDGRLDEAEDVATQLLRDYPDEIDGDERMAMVMEARGRATEAAMWYRRAAEHARRLGFDMASIDWYLDKATALDRA
jgi:hypothetical protein